MTTEHQIRYAQTADGVSIAYAVVGQGPPLLFGRALLSPGIDDDLEFPDEFAHFLPGPGPVTMLSRRHGQR